MARSKTPAEVITAALRQGVSLRGLPPRPTLGALIEHLMRVGSAATSHRPDRDEAMTEYRIDDLAQAAGMTTRNVRSYQGLNLLPPPRRVGRAAFFSDVHLARLRLIGSMLERGYTTAHISELLTAWEHGRDLKDVLGIEEALVSPWTDELPTYLPIAEAREIFGGGELFERATGLGLLQVEGNRALIRRPQLINAFKELKEFGLPLESALELHEKIAPLLDRIADLMVEAGSDLLMGDRRATPIPTDVELADLVPVLQRLRQLATANVHATFAHSIENSIESALGGVFAQLAEAEAARTPTRKVRKRA